MKNFSFNMWSKGLALGFVCVITLPGCGNKVQSSVEDTKADSAPEKQINPQEDKDMDSVAIGNIHLNITREEFEKEKQEFLAENQSLGKLRIQSVTGLFYEDKLAVIQIVSGRQTLHKEHVLFDKSGKEYGIVENQQNGWEYLYRKKYGKLTYVTERKEFAYTRGQCSIYVTDYSASNYPYSSFSQFMEQPLKMCDHGVKPLFPQYEIQGTGDGLLKTYRVFEILPKEKAEFYKTKLEKDLEMLRKRKEANPNYIDIDFYNYKYVSGEKKIYQSIYDAAIIEANDIIRRNNEDIYRKHKNDQSYSVILISFIPAIKKYYYKKCEEKRRLLKDEQTREQKELDKI